MDAVFADGSISMNNPEDIMSLINDTLIHYTDLSILPLDVSFSALIRNTKKHLQIISPYIDRSSVMKFLPDFATAFSNNIEFTLVTRGVLVKEPASKRYNYLNKLEAIQLLWDQYVNFNPVWRTKFVVRDFLRLDKLNNPQRDIYAEDILETIEPTDFVRVSYAVHQKILVSDRTMAYIGSGELRKNSFGPSGEVGVLLKGRQAEFISDLVQCYASFGFPVEPTLLESLYNK